MSSTQRSTSVGRKILLRSVGVAIIPLALLSVVVFAGLRSLDNSAEKRVDESRAVLESESVLVNSEGLAISLAEAINFVIDNRVDDVRGWADTSGIELGALGSALWAADEGLTSLSIDELEAQFAETKNTGQSVASEQFLLNVREANPRFLEIFFTDSNGFNVAYTNETSDFVQSDEAWWQTAWESGTAVEDVEFDDSANAFTLTIAARIDDDTTGTPLGVIKATLDTGFVNDIVERRESAVDYSVILPDGLIMADTSGDSSVLMNADHQLSEGQRQALEAGNSGAVVEGETVFGFASTANTLDASQSFAGFDWLVVSEEDAASAFAPLRGLEALSEDINESGNALRATLLIVLAVALLLAFIIARLMSNAITNPIKKLTSAASQTATVDLPGVVSTMRADIDAEVPAIDAIEVRSDDEIGELATAFNQMSTTAVQLAGEQAASRRSVGDMFLNLGRRNQKMLNRLLRSLDGLQRNEQDPETLEALFEIDSLVTRMRRNSESLLVLAGAEHTRRFTRPVAVGDLIRGALSEVEGFDRVDIEGDSSQMIRGEHVADLIHLLAELIENAIVFSPPQTRVQVVSRMTQQGFMLAVADDGIGMPDDKLQEANRRIQLATTQEETPSKFLGMFVVGRLAARGGYDVRLYDSPTGGVVARIDLPADAIEPSDDSPADATGVADDELTVEQIVAEAPPKMVSPTRAPALVESTTPLMAHVDPPAVEAPAVEEPAVEEPADEAPVVDPQPAQAPATEPGVPVNKFGSVSRKRGANLPQTDVKKPAATPLDGAVTERDPDMVRHSLAGFQRGTGRAEQEGTQQ